MAQKVLIMGESGTGKSTSLRNCDPATTAVINPVGKPLPFKNHFEMLNNETDARKIVKYMKEQCAAGKKLLVVDDFQYILAVPYMNRIKETGWDKYNDFGANYFEIIDCCKDLPDDVVVVYMTHLETLDNGLTTVKLIGKLLREKITIEGLFTVVLRTGVNWLFNQLDILAKSRKGREKIIEAYRYIIGKLIEINGKPDLMKGEKYAPYKDYILFDNIFQIFRSQGTKIIRDIYQSLNDILATDPNYLHQRAKCYIRSAYKSTEEKDKEKWLEMAYRDASISNSSFEKRYESHENEKIMISAAHSLYTAALALCHIAKLRNYRDISINANAVKCLYKAISSPFNSIEFVNNDATYNYNNVVGDLVSTFATDVKYLKDKDAEEKVAELLMMMISNNTEQ